MTESPTQQNSETTVKRRFLFFPLSLKMLIVLAVALAPLVVLALVAAGTIAIAPMSATYLRDGVIHFASFSAPVSLVVVLASCALGLGLGLALANLLVIRPARRLLLWLLDLRRTNFVLVPPLPHKGRDEIGEVGEQMGFAALAFAHGSEATANATEQRSLFVMTAAHQLRTPLTALSWTIDTLQQPDTPPEERAKLLASTGASLARMRLVIEHILASANVEEGKFGYVFEQVDIVPIIEKILHECDSLSKEQKVSLTFTHHDTFPVYADKERISLALTDLISNALQYTPPGGSVVVTASPAPNGESRETGKRLEIAVQDTGIGISEEERPMIFNKLYRGERARHMRPDGSGLGLFVVRNIVERHGSQIVVDSTEGKGTRVSFFLNAKRVG